MAGYCMLCDRIFMVAQKTFSFVYKSVTLVKRFSVICMVCAILIFVALN